MKKFLMFLFVIGFSIFMFSCNTGTSGEKEANIIWGYEGLNK